MTQPVPNRPDGGGGMEKRIAGLPTWGWIAIAAAGGIGLILWIQHRNASNTAATNTTGTIDTSNPDITGALETLAVQVRNLQGQPSQPTPTVPIGVPSYVVMPQVPPSGGNNPPQPVINLPTPTYAAPATAATQVNTYHVVSGDTLWDLASKFYGSGAQYPKLYAANQSTIDSTARTHGVTSDFPGHIYPGETLVIP